MTDTRYTALVLAASRGSQDPLAVAGGVSHKCFIDIVGQPMLRRVVDSVWSSGRVKQVIVQIEKDSIEEARALLKPLGIDKHLVFTESAGSIGASVFAAAERFPDALPMIITTGDNALHTGELVKHFCDELDKVDADAGLGLTPASYVLEKYPEGNRAFHRFRDGAYSSCNLYALLTPKAVEAAAVFNSGGQFGKKPKRLIGAFGLFAFLLYKSRMSKLDSFLRFLSRGLKVRTAPVLIPFAEGPIDVDRQVDWDLTNRIITEREGAKPAAAAPAKKAPAKKAPAKKPAAKKVEPTPAAPPAPTPAPAPAAKKAAPRKAVTKPVEPVPAPAPPKKAPARKPAAKPAEAAPAPAKKPATRKTAAKTAEPAPAPAPKPAARKPAAKAKAPAKTTEPTPVLAPAKKAPARKPAAKPAEAAAAKAPAKRKAPAKPTSAESPAPKPAPKPRARKPKA